MSRQFKLWKAALALVFAASVAAVGASAPAEAGIACSKGFQIVNGQLISTPYCQDNLVADVARAHGFKISAAAIRNNPMVKRNICQYVGRDIRLTNACVDANNYGRRGF